MIEAWLQDKDLKSPPGICVGELIVRGVRIEFHAWKFEDETTNVGRITIR